MGLNTAMIVRNDFLHDIEKDPAFGEKVATAVQYNGNEDRMPYLGQAFSVLSSCHADFVQVVAISGNSIRRLGICGHHRDTDETILRNLAEDMGYELVRQGM